MTAASCKHVDGLSYPTKCFLARTSLRRTKEGAGHWLVAYRKAEGQKYRNLHRSIKETCKKRESVRGANTPHGNTLDGPFLLCLHHVDKPVELCSVDISDRKLNAVKLEDLKVFYNVAYIDASINSLSLDSFSCFVSLRELNLSLNGLCNMTFEAADFPHLQVLDLSYNSLSAEGILSIGRLPHLKVLHLTGNQLRRLPPKLGSSNHDATQLPAEEDTQFTALEVLLLDDNRLSSEVFSCLTDLKRLKYLNLQGNRISEVPYLRLMASSEPLQTSIEERAEEKGLASTEPNPCTDERFKSNSEENGEEHCRGSSLPLPELQFLNLAENKFAEEEALMAVALFPKLREIDIHSNPLTTRRSGDPPLLTRYLHDILGITIKRKKTREDVKLPLKVEERIPKVSVMLMDAPCPTQSEKSQLTAERTPESKSKKKRDDTLQENTEHFFVTQVADSPENEFGCQADKNNAAGNEDRKEDDTIPENYTCYEILMEAERNYDVTGNTGIQTAVQMLERRLRNLNVYRDLEPKLDCIQTPYRKRQKKIRKLPPLRPAKQRAERVDEMIKGIKESTTIQVVPFSSAIHSTGVTKQEALSLLRDMRTKYKMAHKKTMEQAAIMESDRNSEQN
ncbi:X-ray radiation resistance-associated protein 1 isoform X2 [Sparus aurata]|uniref:X-ray radiation resistance-associated protein 1 isoform X2 n=1 Tax=Sparus aurata TaxID=8175 RepID=UPI0011C14692|nr:X-ray radiation resistance-associated protein 1 isoform X2 [Sparus aurata]